MVKVLGCSDPVCSLLSLSPFESQVMTHPKPPATLLKRSSGIFERSTSNGCHWVVSFFAPRFRLIVLGYGAGTLSFVFGSHCFLSPPITNSTLTSPSALRAYHLMILWQFRRS